jgi:hypothetical protein
VLLSLFGHVRARPRTIFDALDARFDPGEASTSLYTADPSAFLVIAQGGWWYRGEYRVVPDADGSNVEHTVLNIGHRRTSGLSARRVMRSAPADFERLLKELRLDLE